MTPRTVLYVHSSAGRYGADRQLLALASGLDPARFRALAVLPDDGPLAGDLRAAGVEVEVRPQLAVLRRALFGPLGLARVAVRYAADRSALGGLAGEHGAALVHANTSVTLGAYAATRRARARHLRPRDLRRLRTVVAGVSPFPAARRRPRLLVGARARAVRRRPARARRARGRDLGRAANATRPGPRRARPVWGRLRVRRAGPVVVVEGPGRPGSRARRPRPGERAAARPARATPGRAKSATKPPSRALAARLGMTARLRMAGFVEEVADVYGAADVVVVPSTRPDPLPNAALEAAAAGCCVVAADHGGLPEILRDGETGRLVPPGDPGALASVLAELAADPGRRGRLGAEAAADVSERFCVARQLERVQDLYDEVLPAP